MNKKRRSELTRAVAMIEDAARIVEDAAFEEQDSFDNLPESIAYSERGEQMEDAVSCLENARGLLGEAITEITEALA